MTKEDDSFAGFISLNKRLNASFLFFLIIFLQLYSVIDARAIETRHGGGFSPVDSIIGSNITYWTFNGHGSPGDALHAQILAEAGVRVMQIIHWWGPNITNPIDIYYNSTIQSYVRDEIDFNMYVFNPDHFWGIILGDEEPGWRRYIDLWETLSPEIAKYNDTYFLETGYWLKPYTQQNLSEGFAFNEWFNEKSVWSYNFIHDYVKSKAPNVKIIQYMIMPPIWGIGPETCAAYELKGDVFAMDCFYAQKVPWLLYESIRRYRASMPEVSLHFDIWGTIWDFVNEGGDGLTYKEGSYEQIRRETWLAYLSGVDVLGWFDWAPQYNSSYDWAWGHQREDAMGKRNWMYIDNLAGQLAHLPVLHSRPEVLVVGDGYQTGEAMLTVADVSLFTEYDLVNQRCFATTDVNVSQYSLVLVTDGWHYEETIEKLNIYVTNGGNVLFLGGINNSESPFVRTNHFDIESESEEIIIVAHTMINITEPNLLELELLNYDAPSHGTYALNITGSPTGYHPIDGFYLVDGEDLNEFPASPLVLYHNESEIDSGWVLYVGASWSYTDPEAPITDKKPDLWFLYREFVGAFARFLNITNSISTNATENMLITQGEVEAGLLMSGISNFNNTNRSFNYTLDLTQFDFPDGSYWVHSLDENMSLGQFASETGILEIPIDMVANGTRLLLISESIPNPNYSIDIFPDIPTYIPDDNETSTTTTTTPTITSPDLSLYAIIGGISIGLVLFVIVIAARKRQKQ